MFLGLPPQEREDRARLNKVMGVAGNLNAYFIGGPGTQRNPLNISRESRYRIADDGSIEELPGFSLNLTSQQQNTANYRDAISSYKSRASSFDSQAKEYPITSLREAINQSSTATKKSVADLEKQYKDQLSQNQNYNPLS